MKLILGIDPGKSGAIVGLYNGKIHCCSSIPLNSEGIPSYDGIHAIFWELEKEFGDKIEAYLERAVPYGMPTNSAFNYGRGFAAVEIAIKMAEIPVHYVESNKWTKKMHEGISKDLKPKVKSRIAAERIFGSALEYFPKNKKGIVSDGYIDALLIAKYGSEKF